jgi:hypothetical protein
MEYRQLGFKSPGGYKFRCRKKVDRELRKMRIIIWILLCFFTSATVAHADCQGQFTPVLGNGSPFSKVMFFPKNGNQIMIGGKYHTIPPGIGVMSGGVVGAYNDAYVEKAPHQTLAPKTLYFVYVFMLNDLMAMNFSQTGHKEDPTYGNEVNAKDPAQSIVGMVYTDSESLFDGDQKSQLTLSWCNRVQTDIGLPIYNLSSGNTTLQEANPAYRISWLQWGINESFTQGSDVPEILVRGTIMNDRTGALCDVELAIDGNAYGDVGRHFQVSAPYASQIASGIAGAGGSSEGFHYASILLGNAGTGGTCKFISGVLQTLGLHS